MRTINDQRAAFDLFAATAARGRFANCDLVNRHFCHSGDVLRINAEVDNGVTAAVHVEIIDDRGAIKNLRDLRPPDAITRGVRIAKISRRHKCEKIYTDAKIETRADNCAVVNNARALAINRVRRQRRPAAIILRIPPANP